MTPRGTRKPTGAANLFSKMLNTEIKVWMTRRGLTLVQLEELSGVSKSRISKTVYKHEAPLNTNELDMLCKALGVTPLDVVRAAERAVAEAERAQRPAVVQPQEAQADYARAAKHRPRRPEPREEDYF